MIFMRVFEHVLLIVTIMGQIRVSISCGEKRVAMAVPTFTFTSWKRLGTTVRRQKLRIYVGMVLLMSPPGGIRTSIAAATVDQIAKLI